MYSRRSGKVPPWLRRWTFTPQNLEWLMWVMQSVTFSVCLSVLAISPQQVKLLTCSRLAVTHVNYQQNMRPKLLLCIRKVPVSAQGLPDILCNEGVPDNFAALALVPSVILVMTFQLLLQLQLTTARLFSYSDSYQTFQLLIQLQFQFWSNSVVAETVY